MLARLVDLCDYIRQRRLLGTRDFLQTSPERIFEADAGLVPGNHDRALDDQGFHERVPNSWWFMKTTVIVIRYSRGAGKYLVIKKLTPNLVHQYLQLVLNYQSKISQATAVRDQHLKKT